jgi:hypothetical protein
LTNFRRNKEERKEKKEKSKYRAKIINIRKIKNTMKDLIEEKKE